MSTNEGISPVVNYEKEGKIAFVAINRPKALNALNDKVYSSLVEIFQQIKNDPEVHVVVVKGDDKTFIAGADITNMANATPIGAETYAELGAQAVQAVYQCDVPVIAYIQGYALGGGLELALACDIRLVGQGAKFGLPEIGLGIIPGTGGTQRLPKLIGLGKAKELILTGEIIDSATALALGLVNNVYPDDKLWEETLKLANRLAAKPLQAVRKAKAAINASQNLAIEDGMIFERHAFLPLFCTHDQKEGMAAFLQKRKPTFTGE
jgi:enoyl-CoA hydratase